MKIKANDFAFSTNFSIRLDRVMIESIESDFLSKNYNKWLAFEETGLWQIEEEVFRDIFETMADNALNMYEGRKNLQSSFSNNLYHIDFGGNPLRLGCPQCQIWYHELTLVFI